MTLLAIAFVAGVLTVLAPCILPLLPIVVGGSAADHSNRTKPLIITGSLVLSVILFTLLLKASTLLIDVPPATWTYLSGGVLLVLGLTFLFPSLWERLPINALLNRKGNELLATGSRKKSVWGDVLMGAALGPVFSTCSPTYFVILATVLPQSFALGLVYLGAYALGLALMLLLVGYLGQKVVGRLTGAADSRGWVKRGMGALVALVGLAILAGFDKRIETSILDAGFFDVTRFEQRLLEDMEESSTPPQENPPLESPVTDTTSGEVAEQTILPEAETTPTDVVTETTADAPEPGISSIPAPITSNGPKAPELAGIAHYLNTNGEEITLAGYRNKKVVLVDFWTYSCINCKRTLPYLNLWHERYGDKGLVIVGVHTPEFAFEQKKENVEGALIEEGINYPVVLDNRYWTWTAFGNRFWPRKYLIDVDGTIVYDHIGEGAYEETEARIIELLEKRASIVGYPQDGRAVGGPQDAVDVDFAKVRSEETYFGASRNTSLGNGMRNVVGVQTLMAPDMLAPNRPYLDGTWNIEGEYAESSEGDGVVRYRFTAKNMYAVLSGNGTHNVQVLLDGAAISENNAGADVQNGAVTVTGERLYHLVGLENYETHIMELIIPPGVKLYTFTFG